MTSFPEISPDFSVRHEEPTEQKRAEARMVVLRSLENAGLRERPPEEVLDRLALLELHTKFNQHARAIERGVRNVLTYLKEHNEDNNPAFILGEDAIRVYIASVIHDIGKTGPHDVAPDEQRLIVDLFSYSIEKIGEPEAVTIEEALMANGVSSKTKEIEQVLTRIGLNLKSTMRKFYDKHAYWTEELLREYDDVFDERIRLIAASHHLDRGIDPCGIFPKLALEGGAGEEENVLGVECRALLALDKYEAVVTRRGRNHREAMAVVRDMLFARFGQDTVMQAVLKVLDELGTKGEIFGPG